MAKEKELGFTLVELVSVIVLLGIVSVSVAPRFSGTGGVAEYSVRDQIISAARFAQQRAMYDHDITHCYRLFVDVNQFGAQRDISDGNGFQFFGPLHQNNPAQGILLSGDYNNITPTLVAGNTMLIAFDGLGNGIEVNCAGGRIIQTTIDVSGDTTVTLVIYPTGYVQRQ